MDKIEKMLLKINCQNPQKSPRWQSHPGGVPGNTVTFPHEAIQGLDFFSAQFDSFPFITSDHRPRVIWKCINEC